MPIELWWWVGPLFYTGFILLIIGYFVAAIIENTTSFFNLPGVVLIVFGIPLAVSILSVVVWFFANLFILIWRC